MGEAPAPAGGPAAASPTDPVASVRGFPAPGGPIDLTLRRGEVVLLRGPNGSGKTSLLRQLAGLDAPLRAAEVRVLAADPRSLGASALRARVQAIWARPRAGLVGLTVAGEARLREVPLPERLHPWRDRDVATLSDGEARKVTVALATTRPTPLLLLDEPCTGLDAEGLRLLQGLIAASQVQGAVVAADHTGNLAPTATRTVELAPSGDRPGPAATPPASGNPVLLAAPSSLRLGRTDIHFPAASWGPGLHAVTGRNGAGKTTLLRRIAGLLPDAAEGGVTIVHSPPEPGRNVTFLQVDAGDLFLAETVRDELAGIQDAEGLVPPTLHDRHPLALSTGEAQRLAIAKALGRDVPVHLLDEPEAHLDGDGRRRLAAAIARRNAAGACVLAATHDAHLAAAAATRTVLA